MTSQDKDENSKIVRIVMAIWVLGPLVVTMIRDRRRYILFGGPRPITLEQKRQRARSLADSFERLGTTYIKLAQFLTTRPDLIPPIYVEELERLQDEVAPAPYDEIKPIIEEDIGDPDEVFDYFEEDALSGASIAQVHKAGINGEDVAVKVRRPGLEGRIETDLQVLQLFEPIGIWALKVMGQKSHAETAENIVEELSKTLREEIDLYREANIMEEVQTNFEKDGLDDRVIVPGVFKSYCSHRVLTMKFEQGIKVKHTEELRAAGHDPREIVDALAEAYLRMAFTYDVFHADPHQGNLAVREDGVAIMYDFGVAQRPPAYLQENFTKLFIGIGLHDPDVVIDALDDMGALETTVDRETMRNVARTMIMDVAGQEIDSDTIDDLEDQVDEALHDYPMKFPQEIILAMRTTFGIEGLCAAMAPEYDFSEKIRDFFISEGILEIKLDLSSIIEAGGGDLVPETLPGNIDKLERTLGKYILFGEEEKPISAILDQSLLGDASPFSSIIENQIINSEELMQNAHPQVIINHINTGGTTVIESEYTADDFNFGFFGAPVEFDEDEMFDVSELEETTQQELEQTSKNSAKSMFGSSMIISGVALLSDGVVKGDKKNIIMSIPFLTAGLVSFMSVKRSFQEQEIMGPKYVATRHQMSEMEAEEEAQRQKELEEG
ncbi:MAG: ABC1 kinase family protein [Halobacteria archaeon]